MSRIWPWIVALAVTVGAVLLVGGHSSASGTETVTRGCVIRFDGGPHIYNVTNHLCDGATSVKVQSDGDLFIELPPLPADTKVKRVDAGEDETLAGIVDCGPSGGIGTTTVRCRHNGVRVSVTSSWMNRPYANLWMEWVYEVPA